MTIDARSLSPARSKRKLKAWHLGLGLVTFMALLYVVGLNAPSPPSSSALPLAADAAPAVHQTEAERIQSDESEFVDLQIQAKTQLSAILKDPDSALYQNVVAISQPRSNGHVSFCGQVNAKNSYGGYAGYARFIVVPRIGAWLPNSPGIKFGEVWRAFCRNDYVIRRAPVFN